MNACLVIATNSYGGAVRVARFVYDILIDMKFNVTVMNVYSEGDGFFNDIEHENLNFVAGQFVKPLFKFKKYFSKNKFDLILGFAGYMNFIIALLNPKAKLIISEHTNHTAYVHFLYKPLIFLAYKRADFITFLSKFDYDFYKIKKSQIMPNPFFMDISDEKFEKENIILFPSRIDKNKRLDFLINAFCLVDEKVRNSYKIVVCGDGSERDRCIKLAKENGVNLEIIRFTKEIDKFYKRAKIVALTSLSEGFPMILIEGIYFDCARISTDCISGPRELIEDGIDGFLCNLNDESEFAKKLEILMSDEKLRLEFCQKARKRKSEFDPKTVYEKWENLIQKVIKR
ncbi:glycosyltransferase [Campylobacter sp. VBCF_06 NA8]|uniref:glycosyltransferase n=1 Tax=Campylobacter sp. VBCF_06 NA8 TaxID=2983822 RepID=UPI0022EA0A5A|nr:glycosyltransferase [Campylobacter sp. VBCF_06 NA8]MDA3046221.1 glycosyltransferase [Campylobacter sp. VBCF_06 NA8]